MHENIYLEFSSLGVNGHFTLGLGNDLLHASSGGEVRTDGDGHNAVRRGQFFSQFGGQRVRALGEVDDDYIATLGGEVASNGGTDTYVVGVVMSANRRRVGLARAGRCDYALLDAPVTMAVFPS